MFNYKNCPVCKQTDFKPFITCKDYTVSKENFQIASCTSCGFKFTNPIPDISKLGDYYKSEDYISHSNTKQGIISKLYHAVRNYTLKGKLKLISEYVSRGTLLDYGCGTGMFLKVCQDAGWKVQGMEPDAGARRIASEMKVKTYADKSELAPVLGERSVDIITLWHVLEHVTDLEDTLTFFKSRLSKNGALMIAVPNHNSFDAKHYKEFWAAYDVPRHLYHFEPKTISKLLAQHGFVLEKIVPMKFDSFYVSMLSEKYKTGSIRYLNAFINGLKSNLKAGSEMNYSSIIYVFRHS
ncbi:MAG: class I SAM-dependent methyltransferase [Bacteroidia bacterium]|nr:class I SAM-dependent methyltransferase [Bacteroidia bacterium]